MTDEEKITKIFRDYYNRDPIGIEDGQNFMQQGGPVDMMHLYDSLDEVEEKFGVPLPETYKAFIRARAGIGMSTMNNCDKFYAFDKDLILDWNIIGSVNAAVDESFENVFVFGVDYCDYCYFIDLNNKYGFGTESVWRTYRSGINKEMLELVGRNFIEFLENFALNEKLNVEEPFKPAKPYKPTVEEGKKILRIIDERARADEKIYQEILEAEKKIDEYIEAAKANKKLTIDFFPIKEKNLGSYGYMGLEPFKTDCFDKFPIKSLAILVHLGDFEIENSYGCFFSNYAMNGTGDRNFLTPELSEYFRFFENPCGLVKKYVPDYIFQDYQNKLGRGAESIYIMSCYGSSIENACYVAKDIVEFIRKICADEPLDLTPIGKIAQK